VGTYYPNKKFNKLVLHSHSSTPSNPVGKQHGKNRFVTATKLGTTNKFFVAATKNFAAATKSFVDRT